MENLNYMEIFNNITNKENKTEVSIITNLNEQLYIIAKFIKYEYLPITSGFIDI